MNFTHHHVPEDKINKAICVYRIDKIVPGRMEEMGDCHKFKRIRNFKKKRKEASTMSIRKFLP
jgi:hypothetical protein